MSFLQLGDSDAQITLGRGKGAVAEDFLDVPQVGLVLEQVRGAGVSPDMAGDAFADPGQFRVFADDGVERGAAQWAGPTGEEQPVRRPVAKHLGADRFDVGFQEPAGHRRKRGHAVFGTFAVVDAQELFLKVHVAHGEGEEFALADAGRVEDFQKGAVPEPDHGLNVGGFEHAPGLLGRKDVAWQRLRLSGVVEFGGGIADEDSFLVQEREEVFHGNKKLVLCLWAACRAVDGRAIVDVALVVMDLLRGDGGEILLPDPSKEGGKAVE